MTEAEGRGMSGSFPSSMPRPRGCGGPPPLTTAFPLMADMMKKIQPRNRRKTKIGIEKKSILFYFTISIMYHVE